jgi:uncharacterized protein
MSAARRATGLAFISAVLAFGCLPAFAQQTIDVGKTGWANKRPVVAAACPNGCPWGEIGEFLQEVMKPLGYDVILCRNCNRDRGPRLVSGASLPPPLDALDARTGTTTRFDAPVDFGITASGILASAWRGEGGYANGGPYSNLRLIAKIEDPTFLLVAVKASSGIKDLSEIKAKKLPVKILAGGGADAVLRHYGMTRADIASWGGAVNAAMGAREAAEFDVIIDDHGTPFMNPEGSHWTILSQRHDLKFLDIPEPVLNELAATGGYKIVSTRWGLLKGVDRNIRGSLIYLIRRYSIDPRTVAENQGVPLHPGAARYYREMGYIK